MEYQCPRDDTPASQLGEGSDGASLVRISYDLELIIGARLRGLQNIPTFLRILKMEKMSFPSNGLHRRCTEASYLSPTCMSQTLMTELRFIAGFDTVHYSVSLYEFH